MYGIFLTQQKREFKVRNKRCKVTVVGHFAGSKIVHDGQIIKTRTVHRALVEIYGQNSVQLCDSHEWKQNPYLLIKNCLRYAATSKNIVILPAQNGLKVFLPLFLVLSKVFGFRLHYVVIGGWLKTKLSKSILLNYTARKIDGIYIETMAIKKDLTSFGFRNTYIVPNFKNIKRVEKSNLSMNILLPHKVCTFSRVLKEKGIEDAINAVVSINTKYKKIIYELDIYGQVDKHYEKRFKALVEESPSYIKYRGSARSEDSVDILKNYYALLFPTHYPTEGIPGTIIDALAAGLPIIASRWNSFDDILFEGHTALGFPIHDVGKFIELLDYAIENNKFSQMRRSCIDASSAYTTNEALKPLTGNFK